MMSNLQDHFLSFADEQLLRATYVEKNYAAINAERTPEAPDALECSFSLDLIQQYLDYVRTEAEAKGISDVRISVCFAQYPDKNFSPKLDPAYKGYQSVFLRADSGNTGGSDTETGKIEGISALNYGNIRPPY